MQYLRSQAKESIKEYVTEQLQAMELFKDTHLVKLELLSSTTTIDTALHYVRTKQQQEQQSNIYRRFN